MLCEGQRTFGSQFSLSTLGPSKGTEIFSVFKRLTFTYGSHLAISGLESGPSYLRILSPGIADMHRVQLSCMAAPHPAHLT